MMVVNGRFLIDAGELLLMKTGLQAIVMVLSSSRNLIPSRR